MFSNTKIVAISLMVPLLISSVFLAENILSEDEYVRVFLFLLNRLKITLDLASEKVGATYIAVSFVL